MVQASNKPSRTSDDEDGERLDVYHQCRYWDHIRRTFVDWKTFIGNRER